MPFHDDRAVRNVLDLVQYANLYTQKDLTDDELVFAARYPDLASQILTVTP